VFNRQDFIAEVEGQGYRLLDNWFNADCACELPLNPERNVKWYSGLLFERQDLASDGSLSRPPSVELR